MQIKTVNEILESIAVLPLEDQDFIIDTLNKRIHENRRAEIAQRGKEAQKNYQNGNVTSGTVKDLMTAINDDLHYLG